MQDGGHVPGHTRIPLLHVIGIVALGILSFFFLFLLSIVPFRLFGEWQSILYVNFYGWLQQVLFSRSKA